MVRLLTLIKRLYFAFIYAVLGGVRAARAQGMRVGSGCRIYPFSLGSEPFLVEIGDRVTIAAGVRLLTHDGATWLVRDSQGRRQKFGRIRIGNDVFVGSNCIILPNVTIGSRVVVGAGSVINRDIPDNSVVVGNPARRVRSFDEYASKILQTCGPLEGQKTVGYRDAVEAWLVQHSKV